MGRDSTSEVASQPVGESEAQALEVPRPRIHYLLRWKKPRWWLLWLSVRTCLWLLPAGLVIFVLARVFPNVTEVLYGRGAFALFVLPLTAATGWIPFSLAELVAMCLAVWMIGIQSWKIRVAITSRRRQARNESSYPSPKGSGQLSSRSESLGRRLLRKTAKVGAFTGLLWFFFLFSFGLNYCRPSLAELHGHAELLASAPPTRAELRDLAGRLIRRANMEREIAASIDGEFTLTDPFDTMANAQNGYLGLHVTFPSLAETSAPPKLPLLSPILTTFGIGGIYFPFTGEAHVNRAAPDWTLPFVACHELAHQKGVAREDEANWLAYMACAANPDPEFRYSGTLMGLLYVLAALGRTDPELREIAFGRSPAGESDEAFPSLSQRVMTDVQAYQAWVRRLSGPTQNFGRAVNNIYLKANAQSDGIASYGRMVDLLIADLRANRLR